jgi:hypothetical protein
VQHSAATAIATAAVDAYAGPVLLLLLHEASTTTWPATMPSLKLLHIYTVSFSREQGAPASLLTAHVAVNLKVWNAAAWMDAAGTQKEQAGYVEP